MAWRGRTRTASGSARLKFQSRVTIRATCAAAKNWRPHLSYRVAGALKSFRRLVPCSATRRTVQAYAPNFGGQHLHGFPSSETTGPDDAVYRLIQNVRTGGEVQPHEALVACPEGGAVVQGHPRLLQQKLLDIGRLTNLGWTASIELRQGVADTYEWYLHNLGALRKK